MLGDPQHSHRRYLLTGAAGFIGSSVADFLLSRGDSVVGIDNFDPTYPLRVKLRNVAWARRQDAYDLIVGDIRDASTLDTAFAFGPYDAVIHLAARAGVRPSIADPLSYDQVNVCGTTGILERARIQGIQHVVLASSSSVYGATSTPPFTEDVHADRPSSPYAATKRANEISAYAHHHLHGLSISCLRFFTVYGPRQRPEMAIHKFTRLIDEGQPVTVFGDGRSRRDYTFIDDIVQGVVAAVDRPHGYRIYNLGTTDTIDLESLIQKIEVRLGKSAIVDRMPMQAGDVPITHADITLAGEELDYVPTTRIDEGLTAFIDWYRELSHPAELPRQIRPSVVDLTEPRWTPTINEVAV